MLIAGAGGLILLSQAMVWLQDGIWNPVTVADVSNGLGLPIFHPKQKLIGLQKLIDETIPSIYGMSGSAFFIVIGIAVCFFGARIEADRQRELRERKLNSN